MVYIHVFICHMIALWDEQNLYHYSLKILSSYCNVQISFVYVKFSTPVIKPELDMPYLNTYQGFHIYAEYGYIRKLLNIFFQAWESHGNVIKILTVMAMPKMVDSSTTP